MTLTIEELRSLAEGDVDRLRSDDGWLQAGLPRYARLFGRDACISAWQVLPEHPDVAEATIRALAVTQGVTYHRRREEQPGKIGHEIPVRTADRIRMEFRKQFRWGFPYYGSIDATAWWVRLVAAHRERTGDDALAREVRPNLERAASWMATDARTGVGAMVAYERVNPAGLEHQAWRDADMEGMEIAPPVAPVELQGYHEAAADALRALGVDVPDGVRGDPDVFDREFWMGEAGIHAFAVGGDGTRIEAITSNPGHLLGTPILRSERAEAVADRLFAPDLWTEAGIRTHSTEDDVFDPDSYQRGSVWPHDNWVIHEGLRAIGRHDQAERLRRAVLDACRHLEVIPELYAVHDDRPVALAIAQPVQAWSCGAVLAFLRAEAED